MGNFKHCKKISRPCTCLAQLFLELNKQNLRGLGKERASVLPREANNGSVSANESIAQERGQLFLAAFVDDELNKPGRHPSGQEGCLSRTQGLCSTQCLGFCGSSRGVLSSLGLP